jgi:hypothetical protein
MHCDSRGADYLREIGLAELWNELTVTIPDDLDGINPKMFWAAGKLFALQAVSCPLIMLDTDFIAWSLPELCGDVVAAHREPLSPNTYPPIEHFKMRDYKFSDDFDYTLEPLNTAFLYMNNDQFKLDYVDNAMDFMKSAQSTDDYLTYMVYAEQRLLAMLAACRKIEVSTLMQWGQLHNQSRYTHTWGAKRVMRDIPAEHERFCRKCADRIKTDFKQWEYIIKLIDLFGN